MPSEHELKRLFAEEDKDAIKNSIQGLSQHRQGRKFLWWLLQIGGVGQQPYAKNALDTSFNCGTLDVGNRILAELTEFAPDAYLTMMKENFDERRTRDEKLRDARGARKPDPDGDTGI